MVHNANQSGGFSFGQSEPLTVRLKGLIQDYPEGIGIVKELIQNADDAGARLVRITLDWRTHRPTQLPDDRMEQLMGPAMLVYNEQVFADKDFDSIRSLGQSQKIQNLEKTGRFGLGFNAVYNVTDFPSFISRDRIIFFDPHCSAIPGATQGDPGRGWFFAQEGWWEKYPTLMNAYQAGGLPSGVENFQGTVFRLPLRTAAHASRSKISKKPFEKTNFALVFEELAQSGEELLLFLKSVEKIQVYEIPEESNGSRRGLLTITTKNQPEVFKERRKLLDALAGDSDKLLQLCRTNPTALPSVSYRHEIETTDKGHTTTSTWTVSSVIRVDRGGEILSAVEKMSQQDQKAVPWAGAAARITTTGSKVKVVEGRAYCFLPLPLKTGLSIHINGFFDLNRSRDNLTSADGQTGEGGRTRAEWNQLLVRHVVSHACANLVVGLVHDIGEKSPSNFYDLWPVSCGKPFEQLPKYVFKLLYQQRVIRSAVDHSGTRWVTPPAVKILTSDWQKLAAPLCADEIDIPEPPLQRSILSAFSGAGCNLETFKPASLRQHLAVNQSLGVPLEQAPRPSLRNRQWIVDMLGYCLSDNHTDLHGLPLALLANGMLQVFGYNPCGFIYLPKAEAIQIFATHLEWFLEPNLFSQVPQVGNRIGVSNMTAEDVATRLSDVLSPAGVYQWQPYANWLALVYRYFASVNTLPLENLKVVPLVPGNDGNLHRGGDLETPLLYGSKTAQETLESIQYFGVPLVPRIEPFWSAVAEFFKKHPQTLIWSVTVPDIIDRLAWLATRDLPQYREERPYAALLNFLADRSWINNQGISDQSRQSTLRQLRIYLTVTNELVALTDEDVYIPGGYSPPVIAGHLKLLRLGANQSSQEWRPLFDLLRVETLDRSTLIRNCLLPEYKSFVDQQRLAALEWIRDNFKAVKAELESRGENFNTLKQRIARTAFVRCTNGDWQPVTLSYAPDSVQVVQQVVGSEVSTPDMEFYSRDSEEWLSFFQSLGMLTTPSADDLLDHVDRLREQARQVGADTVTDSCLIIFKHIEQHWDKLKAAKIATENKTLPEALKSREWLTVERREQVLQKYPGALTPKPKLYKAEEVAFIEDADLVASQTPLFNIEPRREDIRDALGFRPVAPTAVIKHFDRLINFWKNDISNTSASISNDFQRSLNAIYQYLYQNVITKNAPNRTDKESLQSDFVNRACLWDEERRRLWIPKHTFQIDVPFLGERRCGQLCPSSPIRDVYEFLGQRRSPTVDDYIDFIRELAQEYGKNPLQQNDRNCAIQVLQRLQNDLSPEQRSGDNLKNIPLLTDSNLLVPANRVWIPDAPWRAPHIKDKINLLHKEVSADIAVSAGSQSLLRDVKEHLHKKIQIATSTEEKSLCIKWQKTLVSREFNYGLKRLIVHEYKLPHSTELELQWFVNVSVSPAKEILVDLRSHNEFTIATGVKWNHYFDQHQQTFYISCNDDKQIMLYYLAESLNSQIGDYVLQDISKLLIILDKEPSRIKALLDNLQIQALIDPTENSPDPQLIPIGDDIDKKHEAEQSLIPGPVNILPSNSTPVGNEVEIQEPENVGISKTKDPNPTTGNVDWQEFAQRWKVRLYDWLARKGESLSQDKIEAKAISKHKPNVRMAKTKWDALTKLENQNDYELLIVVHGVGNPNNSSQDLHSLVKIIRLSSPWTTLQNILSVVNSQKTWSDLSWAKYNTEFVETLVGLQQNKDGKENDVLLNWTRLLDYASHPNIQVYEAVSEDKFKRER